MILAEYDGYEMQLRGDGWINATHAAVKFGKRPNEWLRLPTTIEYLEEIKATYGEIPYVKTSRARADSGGGTWLHPKLAVIFARWLSVKFAVWCDHQIDSIISGEITASNLRHRSAASYKMMSSILQDERGLLGKETKFYHYVNEAKLVNWALTGAFRPLDRDALSENMLDLLADLEVLNSKFLLKGLPYEDRKNQLNLYARNARLSFTPLLPGETE